MPPRLKVEARPTRYASRQNSAARSVARVKPAGILASADLIDATRGGDVPAMPPKCASRAAV